MMYIDIHISAHIFAYIYIYKYIFKFVYIAYAFFHVCIYSSVHTQH